jgi:hypothetical protein
MNWKRNNSLEGFPHFGKLPFVEYELIATESAAAGNHFCQRAASITVKPENLFGPGNLEGIP